MKNIIKNLENKMIRYQDLLSVEVTDIGEKMTLAQIKTYNNKKISVRQSVNKKLLVAEAQLKKLNSDYQLLLYCGYRSLKVQTKRFLKILSTKQYFDNPIELYESIHRSVAVPTVAGHPTGGGVDIVIKNISKNEVIDFGCKIYDYSTPKYYTFYPKISKQARKNRLLLRQVMTKIDFAPFDGEWWHFSYGDREWAFFYKRQSALYGQLISDKILKLK